jgi:hypothetical protein
MKIILPTDTFFKWSQGAWPVANNIVNNFISVWTLCIIFRNFIFRQNIHICMYVGAYRRFFKGSLGAWPVENNIISPQTRKLYVEVRWAADGCSGGKKCDTRQHQHQQPRQFRLCCKTSWGLPVPGRLVDMA